MGFKFESVVALILGKLFDAGAGPGMNRQDCRWAWSGMVDCLSTYLFSYIFVCLPDSYALDCR